MIKYIFFGCAGLVLLVVGCILTMFLAAFIGVINWGAVIRFRFKDAIKN